MSRLTEREQQVLIRYLQLARPLPEKPEYTMTVVEATI